MRVMMLMDMMWHMDDEMRAENKFVFVSNIPIIYWALKLFMFKKKRNSKDINNVSSII